MNERKTFGLPLVGRLPRVGARAMGKRHAQESTRASRGFTLVEMLVVIALILLVAGLAMPGITQLFRSGADAQAYNLMAAQINATRTYAMQNNCYACLHLQVATGPGSSDAQTTVGIIFVYDSNHWPNGKAFGNKTYVGGFCLKNPATLLPTGFDPQSYPGHYAFGQASLNFIAANTANYQPQVANTNFAPTVLNPTDRSVQNVAAPCFTSVNIIFTPSGDITTTIAGQTTFAFDTTSTTAGPFYSTVVGANNPPASVCIWDGAAANSNYSGSVQNNGFIGVNALTMFSMTDANASVKSTSTAATDFTNFMTQNGQLLPINVYTGQLFTRS